MVSQTNVWVQKEDEIVVMVSDFSHREHNPFWTITLKTNGQETVFFVNTREQIGKLIRGFGAAMAEFQLPVSAEQAIADAIIRCENCKGTGKAQQCAFSDHDDVDMPDCLDCDGTGEIAIRRIA
jgi:hypothetical protein